MFFPLCFAVFFFVVLLPNHWILTFVLWSFCFVFKGKISRRKCSENKSLNSLTLLLSKNLGHLRNRQGSILPTIVRKAQLALHTALLMKRPFHCYYKSYRSNHLLNKKLMPNLLYVICQKSKFTSAKTACKMLLKLTPGKIEVQSLWYAVTHK